MMRRTRLISLAILSFLSVFLLGQACGVTRTVEPGNDDDPLAPLVPEDQDPLAPLTPRGTCGVWSGTLTGLRREISTLNATCPGDTVIVRSEEKRIDTGFTLLMDDRWSADPYGGPCFRAASGRPLVTDGRVNYRRTWTDNEDYDPKCNKYTHDGGEETYAFTVEHEDVTIYVEIDTPTYTEGQDLLSERPCRTDYPVLVTIHVSDPANGTGNYSSTHVGNDDCWPGPATETTDKHAVTQNSASAFIAVLHGTYHIDPNGNDTLEASRDTGPITVPGCPGMNSQCTCSDSDQLIEQFTLSLRRSPEGDRDNDAMCDSVDGCPDQPWDYEPPCGE